MDLLIHFLITNSMNTGGRRGKFLSDNQILLVAKIAWPKWSSMTIIKVLVTLLNMRYSLLHMTDAFIQFLSDLEKPFIMEMM